MVAITLLATGASSTAVIEKDKVEEGEGVLKILPGPKFTYDYQTMWDKPELPSPNQPFIRCYHY